MANTSYNEFIQLSIVGKVVKYTLCKVKYTLCFILVYFLTKRLISGQ